MSNMRTRSQTPVDNEEHFAYNSSLSSSLRTITIIIIIIFSSFCQFSFVARINNVNKSRFERGATNQESINVPLFYKILAILISYAASIDNSCVI